MNMADLNFFHEVSAQLMLSSCKDCGQGFAEIDGLCSFCRVLARFVAEARRLPLHLRGWATDQTRVWVSLLQEEAHKYQVAEEERKVRESATPKAASPCVSGLTGPPKTGGAPTPPAQEEPLGGGEVTKKESEEEENKGERGASPVGEAKTPREGSGLSEEEVEEEEEEEAPTKEKPARYQEEGQAEGVERPEGRLSSLMALRRPAAAKAAPRRIASRRPAAVEEEDRDIATKFRAGDFVDAAQVPLAELVQGTELVVRGEYWQGECQVCGTIRGLQVKGAKDVELALGGEGTNHEELLKWISSNPRESVRVHLCGSHCTNKVEANGLVHAKEVRRKKEGDGGWTENLKETVDELEKLRKEAEAEDRLRKTEDEQKDAKEREDKEKKKKKKKEKRRRSSSERDADKRPAKDPKKKLQSQKELKQVFGTTGLDPDPRVRKRVVRRLRRKMKKKKDDSSSSTVSSSEGSSRSASGGSSHSDDVFQEKHKVRAIARKAPGALTYATVKEMQKQLLTTSGAIWDTSRGSVPPVALQYYRSQLVSKLSGGAAREALTLCWALDQALQGRVSECTDTLAQRLKSVELTAGGSSWMVSQRIEVVPPEKGQLSTRAEAQEAARETRDELKVKNMTKGKEKGKGESYGGPWRPNAKGETKGKDRNKGKKGNSDERRKDS
eukprot:s1425_g5.t1